MGDTGPAAVDGRDTYEAAGEGCRNREGGGSLVGLSAEVG